MDSFEYRDSYHPPPKPQACKQQEPTSEKRCALANFVLHELMAQRSNGIRDFGPNLVIARPLQNTNWDAQYKTFKRAEEQKLTSMAVIALTDLATAKRYRLPVAELTSGGSKPAFVSPGDESMSPRERGYHATS